MLTSEYLWSDKAAALGIEQFDDRIWDEEESKRVGYNVYKWPDQLMQNMLDAENEWLCSVSDEFGEIEHVIVPARERIFAYVAQQRRWEIKEIGWKQDRLKREQEELEAERKAFEAEKQAFEDELATFGLTRKEK